MSGAKATSVQAPTLNDLIMGSEGLSQTNNSEESCIWHDDGKSIPLNQLQDWQIDALKMREASSAEDKVGLFF